MSRDLTLRHGYTLADVDAIARTAAVHDRSGAGDYDDRYTIAWSAAALALYEADTRPDRRDLVRAGWHAIYQEIRAARRDRGWSDTPFDDWDRQLRPRFVTYWADRRITPSPEPPIVERTAVWQILPTLTPLCRDALVALAVHGGYQQAADALGISYVRYHNRVRLARAAVLRWWHEGETPHRMPGHDKRAASTTRTETCKRGHPRTPETTREVRRLVRTRLYTIRTCRLCEQERSRRRYRERRRAAA